MQSRTCQLVPALAILIATATQLQARSFFSDNFESYADTAEMNSVWSNGGTATLDTNNGNPGSSLNHPGTADSNAGNTNLVSVGPVKPIPGEVLVFSADIYDDGAINKRVTAGLRQTDPPANFIEMGMYNAPIHYAFRTVLFDADGAFGGPHWLAFENIRDDNGQPIDNQPIAGWHRFQVEITTTSLTYILDLNSDGFINATATVFAKTRMDGFDTIRLGGPSGLMSRGGGGKFDNISLRFIPEPTGSILLVIGLVMLAATRRHIAIVS